MIYTIMVVSKDTPVKKTTRTTTKKTVSDMNDGCNMQSCNGVSCCSSNKIRGIIITLLLLANLASTRYAHSMNNSFEIMRNGGRENYNKIQAMMQTDSYKEYATQGVDMMIMQMQQQNTQGGDMSSLIESATGDIANDMTEGYQTTDTSDTIDSVEERGDM